MEALVGRYASRPRPHPDSLTISIDETARLQPRGELPPLPPVFHRSPSVTQLDVAPSSAPGVSEILDKFRTEVQAAQFATDAGKAFLADHPETLQTFRLERPP